MSRSVDISNELKEISPVLSELGPVIPFKVPEGYFEGLSDMIIDKIQAEVISLPSVSESFQVPEGYFEQFSQSIIAKIKAAESDRNEIEMELEEVAPLLNTISRKPVFTLPEGYFDSTDFASNSTKVKSIAPVFSLRSARRLMQYAAAAVVTGVLIMGAFMFTDNGNINQQYEQYKQIDIPSGLNHVSDEALENYLSNPDHTSVHLTATANDQEEEILDVKSNIQNLSDDELTQYLNENAEPASKVSVKNK